MKEFSFIFPDGSRYICKELPTENYISTVKVFLVGLSISNPTLFKELCSILVHHYSYGNNLYNYDDFAVFTLGWIKLTNHYTPTFCFAGYDWQYIFAQEYYVKGYIIDSISLNRKVPTNFCTNTPFTETLNLGRIKLLEP